MSDEEAQEDELLALASIYDGRTFIHTPEENGGQFSVFLELPEHFKLNIYATHLPKSRRKRRDSTEQDQAVAGPARRRDSGMESVEIAYLPPIALNFMLPPDYPSKRPPNYTLSCKWLTRKQLSKLCKCLDDIWEEQGAGDVILFRWTQFLLDETLNVLRISSPFPLRYHRKESHPMLDIRAIQDVASYTLLVAAVLDYEQNEKARVFDTSYFTCNVCFCEKPGTSCMSFHDCGHIYCRECMSGYFTVQIKDGSVKALTCPSEKCESQALPSQVKQLVSEDVFVKYDRFLLQSSLDGMSDIAYCPRPDCQSPVMVESESTMGLCPVCAFAFCVICRHGYHGISPCSVRNSDFQKLRSEYFNSGIEERELMEKRYGRNRLKQIFEDVVSEEWVKSHCTKCPSCEFPIQKIDGCNKMTCTKCRTHFCWICRHVLLNGNPYLHFNKLGESCYGKLFEGIDNIQDGSDDDDDDDWALI